MSKIIRTQKPSVLPFYAMALVFLGLCAVLPVYKLWALLAALGGALIAFGAAQKVCPPRVVEHEVPFHTGVEDVDAMLTDIQQKLDTLHTLNEQLPDPQLSAASIATAFENQLDALYAAESMDLSADITVLQNMLKGQGLS